mgnify:CR=1 FL=1
MVGELSEDIHVEEDMEAIEKEEEDLVVLEAEVMAVGLGEEVMMGEAIQEDPEEDLEAIEEAGSAVLVVGVLGADLVEEEDISFILKPILLFFFLLHPSRSFVIED